MACYPKVLQTPAPPGHFVQSYDVDTRALVKNVAHYLFEGLKRQENALVIATPQHRDAFLLELRNLGAHPEAAIADSRLVLDLACQHYHVAIAELPA